MRKPTASAIRSHGFGDGSGEERSGAVRLGVLQCIGGPTWTGRWRAYRRSGAAHSPCGRPRWATARTRREGLMVVFRCPKYRILDVGYRDWLAWFESLY